MLQNYFKIAARNLWRNKLHAFINVLGLSIGLGACLVIYLLAEYELSFDTFRTDKERIYRIYSSFDGVFSGFNRGVPTAMASLVEEEQQLIESSAAFQVVSGSIKVDDRDLLRQQEGIAIASPTYFDVFPDYEWLVGNPVTSLSEPYKAVLTEERAKQYFDITDPGEAIGQQFHFRDSLPLTVAGIIANIPKRTDLDFEMFISHSTIEASWLKNNYEPNNWSNTNSSHQVFVKLQSGIEPEQVEATLGQDAKALYKKDSYFGDDVDAGFHLQSFTDLHYNADLSIFDHSREPAHMPTLYALLSIAGILLFIAIINFINLETAQASRRSLEVGIRKAIGGTRKELIIQFLLETLVLTVVAVAVSLALAKVGLRYFADYIPEGVGLDITSPLHLSFLLGLTLTVALLAGAYPAFIMSGYKPAFALKGKAKNSGHVNLRRGLIIFQFIIAQALIFGNLAIGQQLNYMLNKDMGFEKDAIVYFYVPWQSANEKKIILANELRAYPEIKALSLHEQTPASSSYSTTVMKYQSKSGEEIKYSTYRKFGDTSFIHLYGMDIIAGRNMVPSDTLYEILVNEAYAEYLGFDNPADALGEQLDYGDGKMVPIVGVVDNFHFSSLHDKIEPVVIGSDIDDYGIIGLKLQITGQEGAHIQAILERMEQSWNKIYPGEPFEYNFLDETIANFYRSERRASVLSTFAMSIAILISCLGLLGLISYTTAQRTKEIGIRKVLGASVQQLVALLTKDFVILVLVAAVVALPIGWYMSKQWLQDFAYHIHLDWWMFVLVTGAAILIALLTVSFRALRAALANPADSLKYE
ncbi:MAG: ABC transporter permease [Chitinophagales bacterium]|nr:ABC transporter permease [Chitinophagales bacterium]